MGTRDLLYLARPRGGHGTRHILATGLKMPNFSAQCVKGVQGIGYVCSFLLSLCICVPMSMHQDQFKGHCLLFSTGVWQEKDGQLLVSWANQVSENKDQHSRLLCGKNKLFETYYTLTRLWQPPSPLWPSGRLIRQNIPLPS